MENINSPTKISSQKTASEALDAEWLRAFYGCEKYTENEALEIIKNLRTLAKILVESRKNSTIINDNQTTEY